MSVTFIHRTAWDLFNYSFLIVIAVEKWTLARLTEFHFGYFTDTMMKFASFETIVEQLYKHAIPTPKDQCSNTTQLGVSFAGGYLAGILCAVVSHPADNLVSFLNNAKGATVGDVSKHWTVSSVLIFGFILKSEQWICSFFALFVGCE